MFEQIAVSIVIILAFISGFLLGCRLTLSSINQDGIPLVFDGNAWKIKENHEKNS